MSNLINNESSLAIHLTSSVTGRNEATTAAKSPTRQIDAEPAKPTSAMPKAALAEAALKVQKFVEPLSSDLQFSVDETSGARVVRVVDRTTQELIRQIPSEEMLAISAALDKLQGLLIKQKA